MAIVTFWVAWRKNGMTRAWLLILTVFLISISVFKAWQTQFEGREKAEATLNERLLEGTILRANINQLEVPDATLFLFEVEVRNKSMTDTIADNWNLDVVFPGDKQRHRADRNYSQSGQYRFIGDDGAVITYAAENDLRVKASASAIPHGGKVMGTVSFELANIKKDALPIGTQFELSFMDINRTNYICGGFTNYNLENRLKGPFQPMPGIKP